MHSSSGFPGLPNQNSHRKWTLWPNVLYNNTIFFNSKFNNVIYILTFVVLITASMFLVNAELWGCCVPTSVGRLRALISFRNVFYLTFIITQYLYIFPWYLFTCYYTHTNWTSSNPYSHFTPSVLVPPDLIICAITIFFL